MKVPVWTTNALNDAQKREQTDLTLNNNLQKPQNRNFYFSKESVAKKDGSYFNVISRSWLTHGTRPVFNASKWATEESL